MPNRTCGECKECFVTVVCGFSGERVDACKPDCACDRFIASPAGEIIESLGIKMTNNQQRFSAESYAGSGRCCPACWNDISLNCPEWLVAKATQIVEERDRLRDEAKSNERRLVNYVDDIAAREESCAAYRAEVARLLAWIADQPCDQPRCPETGGLCDRECMPCASECEQESVDCGQCEPCLARKAQGGE